MIDDLTKLVIAAFADVPMPAPDCVVDAPAEYLLITGPEQDVAEAYCGRQWHEITPRDLCLSHGLPLLRPAAFIYYLQAHLIAAIRNPEEFDVGRDYMVHSLGTLVRSRDQSESIVTNPNIVKYRTILDGLTSQQKSAIVGVCKWIYARECSFLGASREFPLCQDLKEVVDRWSDQS